MPAQSLAGFFRSQPGGNKHVLHPALMHQLGRIQHKFKPRERLVICICNTDIAFGYISLRYLRQFFGAEVARHIL